MIVCGDFNVWSQSRLALLEQKVHAAGLDEANVLGHRTPNLPTWVSALTPLFGVDPEIPLDRIYARGIDIVECRSIDGMESSDHAPLLLRFKVQE